MPDQPHTGRGTRDNCPTCGASVEVVTGAEGTSYFRATDLAERLLDYANRFEDNAGVPSNALEADLREAAQLARAASPPHTGEALRLFDISITPACQQRGKVARDEALEKITQVVDAQLARKRSEPITVTIAVEVR